MDLPRPKWYKVDELAEYWGKDSKLVKRYIEAGQLVSSIMFCNWEDGSTRWVTNVTGHGWFDHDQDQDPYYETGFPGYILLEDAERFEKEYGQAPVGAELRKILNPDHPWHSENLALAVTAWLDLYAGREGDRGDNAYRPSGGNEKLIRNWLKENSKVPIGPTTEAHFRVIINPSKQGGPQKISED